MPPPPAIPPPQFPNKYSIMLGVPHVGEHIQGVIGAFSNLRDLDEVALSPNKARLSSRAIS